MGEITLVPVDAPWNDGDMAVSPTTAMIGRVDERDRVVRALTAGARGEASTVLIRGEAGIGKTRLVTEALAATTSQLPRVVCSGQCVNIGTIGAPFTPIRRLLRDLVDGVGIDALRAAAGTPAVVSTLARLVPQVADGPLTAPAASDDYVAEAIERVIEVVSKDHHVVLVVEDLHWADTASLALLHTLAATMRGTHVTIIMTMRSGEVGRGHPLREALVEIERNRAVAVIDLVRFTPQEVAEQAGALLGEDLDAERLASLVARSDGVPFFVEELAAVPGDAMPPTLREVTMVRVDRLSEGARAAVRLAAVGGTEVPAQVLEAVWRSGPETLDGALREAVEGNVLVMRDGRFVFRHALIREAVYADLMPSEASAMHRRYANLLQSRLDAGQAEFAALASEHWLATHDPAKAFAATVIARHHAAGELATENAAALGERLLMLWDAVPDAAQVLGATRQELLLEIASQYQAVHRVRACMRTIDEALALADPDDAAARVPLEFLYLGVSQETERAADDRLHLAEIERLLRTYTGLDAEVLRARAACITCAFAPWEERLDAAERAFELAHATGDKATMLEALRRRSRVYLDSGRFDDAIADLTEAENLGEALGEDLFWIANNTVCAYLSRGDFEQAVAYGSERVDSALAVGRERAIAPTLSNLAEGYFAIGRLDAGLAAARRSRALMRGDSAQFTMNALQTEALGLVWADRRDEARELLAQESQFGSLLASNPYWMCLWGIPTLDLAVADAHELRGHAARERLLEARRWVDHLSTEGDIDGALDASLVSVSAWLAAFAAGEAPVDVVDGTRMVAEEYPDPPWWAASKAIAQAYLADRADAVAAWRSAVALAKQGRCPQRYLWLSRYELGRALVAAGERREGLALLEGVTAAGPGFALVARWADAELAAAARAGRASGGPLADLTPRELEVLALVAEGLTNGEIGRRLFISPKTASVHVSAILAKLGAANRAEAASRFTAAA